MPVTIEVLRCLSQWVRVDLGKLPYNIKSNVSNASLQYVVFEDEDRIGSSLLTLRPVKDKLSAVIPDELGKLFDIEITELEQGRSVSIEGILPGHTKSEMLRLTQG
jgi:hypothetical protein